AKNIGTVTTARCSRCLTKRCCITSTAIWRKRIRRYFFFCAHFTENEEGNSSSKKDPDPARNTNFFVFGLSSLSFRRCYTLIIRQSIGRNCTNRSTGYTRSNHTADTRTRVLLGCSTGNWRLLSRRSLTRLLIRLSRLCRTLHAVTFTATGTFCFSCKRRNQ